ncbi:MAG: DUF4055 domain-containing protein [Trueperaceae bacterium]
MAEAVATKHPLWEEMAPEWRLMRAAAMGETTIKEGGELYLPRPSGWGKNKEGNQLYNAYKARARFPEILAAAVQSMVGVIHQAEHKIEMPSRMEAIWERATADGLPLEAFHRRITAEVLTTGRYAVLADAASTGDTPWLAGYQAEALINWADDRTMFVLDESGLVRDGFQWAQRNQYLALLLENGRYVGVRYDAAGEPIAGPAEPTTARREPLPEIPLVVIGPRDLSLTPEAPPLIGIARAAVAMYQLSADYRWSLYMSGQETLVIINGERPSMVGAGVVISLMGTENITPDAKYVGPSGNGIEAHRKAIEDEAKNAANAGARLFNTEGNGRSQESGDARRIRYAAETASLLSVAQASAAGLEKSLRYVGRLMGLSDSEIEGITVRPPKTIVDQEMTPERMAAILGLWEKALISYETAYENLQAGGIANPDRSWEEELDLIEQDDLGREEDEAAALSLPRNDADAA